MHLADGNDRFAQIPANAYVSISVHVRNRRRRTIYRNAGKLRLEGAFAYEKSERLSRN